MNGKYFFITTLLLTATSAPVLAGTPVIDQRQANQEHRIEQGVQSGELTHKEAVRLEAQQYRIDKAEDRAKADGKVTRAERRQLQQKQNNASRNIHHQKHDRQHRK
jgi:hypothetical protein